MTGKMMFLRDRLHRIGKFLFTLLFGMRAEGDGVIPRRGRLIVVCNHISEMDPPVLGSCIPRRSHFMAKMELFSNRLGEFYMPRIGAFPVWSKSSSKESGLGMSMPSKACSCLGG